MCKQFIVVTSYDELIINKVYNKYAIIYIQHSPKKKIIITQNITRTGNLLVTLKCESQIKKLM